MKNILGMLLVLAVVLSALTVGNTVDAVQKDKEKKWTEWNQKEAEKMLSNSPWAQIQKDTDTSEMFFQPTADPRMSGGKAPNSTRVSNKARRIRRRT